MKSLGDGLISLVGAGLLTAADFLFGGGELKYTMLTLLIIGTLLDWNSGRRAATKDGINASEYGIDGVWRTGQIYLILVFAHWIDKTFLLDNIEIYGMQPQGVVFYVFAAAILLDTIKSVTANHARLGWDKWIPDWLLKWVANEIENKIARATKRKKEREEILNGNYE